MSSHPHRPRNLPHAQQDLPHAQQDLPHAQQDLPHAHATFLHSRRDFLRTLGATAVATGAALHHPTGGVSMPFQSPFLQRVPGEADALRVVIFHSADFPTIDTAPFERATLERAARGCAVTFADADALAGALAAGCDVLVTAHGSSFPVDAADALARFLQAGGNWVHPGGVPAAVPVFRESGVWVPRARTTAWHKRIGITQAHEVRLEEALPGNTPIRKTDPNLRNDDSAGTDAPVRYTDAGSVENGLQLWQESHARRVFALTVRFTTSKDFPSEDGSSGPRDAILRPAIHALDAAGHAVAAPVVCIDRLLGSFAGGRWVLAPIDGVITADALAAMIRLAAIGAVDCSVRPTFACYRDGEMPAFGVRLLRPRGMAAGAAGEVSLTVTDARGRVVARESHDLIVSGTLALLPAIPLRGRHTFTPGLHRVRAHIDLRVERLSDPVVLEHTSGFWIHDADLLASGAPLTASHPRPALLAWPAMSAPAGTTGGTRGAIPGIPQPADPQTSTTTAAGSTGKDPAGAASAEDTGPVFRDAPMPVLMRDGEPFPVCGTTYMAGDTHRKFLLEPNPHVWDRDMAAMRGAGVTLIRTGVWTAWRAVMLDVGSVDERALRALDAFFLTARAHGLHVIFTFFAFTPEAWGGENPWLDARATSAQQELLATIAARYRTAPWIIWDLINEPTFGAPSRLWSCRPNYDAHERAAWQRWLRARYDAPDDETFRDRMRERWRTTPDDALDLPAMEEFEDRNIFYAHRPLRATDYRLFAQDMFAAWIRLMRASLRSAGHPAQLVMVGQDEGGTYERPSPMFFSADVDISSNHTWWLNDDLVFDSVMTAAPGIPHLVQETGVMFYERIDGAPWRSEDEAAMLLERKLAIAFGTGAAGAVQWLWNTNCYMNSDNEAAIGWLRADGTEKPELTTARSLHAFIAAHTGEFRAAAAPGTVVVIPHANMFSVRNGATAALRVAVRTLCASCGIPIAGAGEFQLAQLGGIPRLLVVPSPRILSRAGWQGLEECMRAGATVLLSGPFDEDEHWLPTGRADIVSLRHRVAPVSQTVSFRLGERSIDVPFRGEKMQRVETAWLEGDGPGMESDAVVLEVPIGAGCLIWCPVPVELGDDPRAVEALYRHALTRAGVAAPFSIEGSAGGVVVLPRLHDDGALYALINEGATRAQFRLRHGGSTVQHAIDLPSGCATILLLGRDGTMRAQWPRLS